jgi:hypothetical protein
MNLNDAEIKTIWLQAYNAALTGLLADGRDEQITNEQSALSPRDDTVKPVVSIIGQACIAFADQALKDARAHTLT